MEKNIEISLLFDFYKPLLTESQRQAVELYYNDDYSLAEIAEDMNITRQGVRDLVKRSENLLFGYEEKLGLFKRFKLVEKGLDGICSLAQNIIDKTDDSSAKSNAQKILSFAEGLKE